MGCSETNASDPNRIREVKRDSNAKESPNKINTFQPQPNNNLQNFENFENFENSNNFNKFENSNNNYKNYNNFNNYKNIRNSINSKYPEPLNSDSFRNANYPYNREQVNQPQMKFAEGNQSVQRNEARNIQAPPSNINASKFNNYPRKLITSEQEYKNNLNFQHQNHVQEPNYLKHYEEKPKDLREPRDPRDPRDPRELNYQTKDIQDIQNIYNNFPYSPKEDYYQYSNVLNNDFMQNVAYHQITPSYIPYSNIPVVIDPHHENQYYPDQVIKYEDYPKYYHNLKSTLPQNQAFEYLENQKPFPKKNYQPRIIWENRYIYPLSAERKIKRVQKRFEDPLNAPEIVQQNQNLNNFYSPQDEEEVPNEPTYINKSNPIRINRQTLKKDSPQVSPERSRENNQSPFKQSIQRYKATPIGGIKS